MEEAREAAVPARRWLLACSTLAEWILDGDPLFPLPIVVVLPSRSGVALEVTATVCGRGEVSLAS